MSASRRFALPLLPGLILAACGPAPTDDSMPSCRGTSVLILMAQSVPSASYVPCISEFPVGWHFGGQVIETGRSEFWLGSDRAGDRAVTVTLTRTCDTSGAVPVPTEEDEAGTRRYEEPEALPPRFAGNRYYVFPGGCITYRFSFAPAGSFAQAIEATRALSFVAREEGVRILMRRGVRLCGRGVSCPG